MQQGPSQRSRRMCSTLVVLALALFGVCGVLCAHPPVEGHAEQVVTVALAASAAAATRLAARTARQGRPTSGVPTRRPAAHRTAPLTSLLDVAPRRGPPAILS